MFIFLFYLSIKAQGDDQCKIINTTPSNDGKSEANKNVIFNKNYAKENERTYTEEELIFLDDLTDTINQLKVMTPKNTKIKFLTESQDHYNSFNNANL